jgi:co-chaperonin GroES (HSP10)
MPLMKPRPVETEVEPTRVERLLGDWILVRILEKSKNTKSGLRLVREFDTKSILARVQKLPEGYDGPLKLRDLVIIPRWTGREWESKNETLCVLHADAILAIVEP